MATVKTHDLEKCNRLYPTIPSVNEAVLYPYNGLIVQFDNDIKKSYKVRKNVQGRFVHPNMASAPAMGRPDGIDSVHTVTSMKMNGAEILSAPAVLSLTYSDLIYTDYPNYTMGTEYLYTNNIANGVYITDSLTSTGNNYNNFYKFIESIVNDNDINVNVSKSPALWWSNDEFARLDNIILEKYYDDNFEFTFNEELFDGATHVLLSERLIRFVFNGETVAVYIDGVLQPNPSMTPVAQFSDSFSFFSYDYAYDVLSEIIACPVMPPFYTSLSTNGCSNLETSCDCKKIFFSDNSFYDNAMPGHNPEFFTSRTITITRPDGTTYILATSDITDSDVIIPPHFNSNNSFQYAFGANDVDGIYKVQICTYPDWQSDVLYETFLQHIVRKDGKLYKINASSIGADPSLTSSAPYWTEYTCNTDCEKTRYCSSERIVVLCISLLKCFKKMVKEAFCGVDSSPCKSIADNKDFIDSMKFKVILQSLEFSSCANDWDSVQKNIDTLKKICCCGR